ncbi:MAG: RIP metalloprotease RseP [Muribaculaceae bacterium]|nr:RIP metalloprotease RseP [Muribaculaceae bacterium]
METFLIKALQLILALSLLVIIHELGHFLWAKVFKIRVEKFYLFFNPWFSLAKWKPRNSDTTYGIGWLPLGGYVKIAGMIDESMDREQMAQEPKEWEFRSKPAWQRLLVMTGGVVNNFILAILIYAGIAWYWGEKSIPYQNAYEGMDFTPAAQALGFRNGDILLTADGSLIDARERQSIYRMLDASEVKVLRNHTDTVTLHLPSDAVMRMPKDDLFMGYRVPVFIKKLMPGEPAMEAGLLPGDRIVQVGDSLTPAYTEFVPALAAYAGHTVPLKVVRDGREMTVDATPTEAGKLGFGLMNPLEVFECDTVEYNIFQAVPRGISNGTGMLVTYVSSLKHVFTKDGAQSIGGFGAIGDMFPEKWNWRTFWEMTAFLSIILAFMNIIPIPALDGGHVMFLLWEVVTRRKPSEKFMEYAQMAGMFLLFALLIYANTNDIYRFFIK